MKRIYFFYVFLAVVLASCSSAYKSTQTPDDVYYSPAPPADVAKEEKEKRNENNSTNRRNTRYNDYAYTEDCYLRMKVANRNRWSTIDDYSYWYDTRYNDFYTSSYWNNGFNTNFCNCYGNTSVFYPGYYNPYIGSFYTGFYNSYPFTSIYIINPKVTHPNVNRPRIGGFSNSTYSSGGSSAGSALKKIFGTGNNSGTYRSTDRSYTPSSGSSGGSSSSSSGGRVSRPGRN